MAIEKTTALCSRPHASACVAVHRPAGSGDTPVYSALEGFASVVFSRTVWTVE